MKAAITTICTESHIGQAVAMLRSLIQYNPQISAFVLLLKEEVDKPFLKKHFADVSFISLDDISETSIKLPQKYGLSSNELRWSLKPAVLKYLISMGFHKLFYADNDLFFFSDIDFLVKDLTTSDILLFPHWRISSPEVDADWFSTNFTDGVYNAGFVGVNARAVDFLDWWYTCCNYKCEKNHKNGFHDDQRYLDLVPSLFEKTKIVHHKGCNVAYWNMRTLLKEMVNGELVIEKKYPLVFAHFTSDYIRILSDGQDSLMLPFLRIAQRSVDTINQRL